MKADDDVEEGLGDGCRLVGVAERNEVRMEKRSTIVRITDLPLTLGKPSMKFV